VSGAIAPWFLNGTILVSGVHLTLDRVPNINWKIVGRADFDRDRSPDLVWQNQATGQIGVWFMNGTTLIHATLFTPGQVSDTNWKIPNVWTLVD
jgi:hypothetical protein